MGRANTYLLHNSGETNGRRAYGGRVSAEELSARVANGDRFEVRPAAARSDDRSSTPLFYVSPAGVPSMLDRKFKNSAVGQLVVLVAACDGEKR